MTYCMLGKRISPVSVASILLQLFAYILVPYSLDFFSLSSVSTYSIIIATAAPFSVAITFYSDNSILADSKGADLFSSLAHITVNAILCILLFLLFWELPISSGLFSRTLSTPLVLLTILIAYQISINKILGSHLILHRNHRFARLGGCIMPILCSVSQLILCLGLKISFLTSLVLGSISSLSLINALILLFLLRKNNLSIAAKNITYAGQCISSLRTQFSYKTLPCFHLRFLKNNFSGALGLFLASISTASFTWLIYFFCGNKIAAYFFIAQKFFSPISTINSVWLIPKALSALLAGSNRASTCRSIRAFSLVLTVMTLFCSLTLFLIKTLPFTSTFLTLKNIPLIIIFLLFILTTSQQVSILCTLPQIIASRTGLILLWQSILLAATLLSAILAHLVFSHLPGSSSLQILLVASSTASVYIVWARSSYSHYFSSPYKCC